MFNFCPLPHANCSTDLQPCWAAGSGKAVSNCLVSLTEVVGCAQVGATTVAISRQWHLFVSRLECSPGCLASHGAGYISEKKYVDACPSYGAKSSLKNKWHFIRLTLCRRCLLTPGRWLYQLAWILSVLTGMLYFDGNNILTVISQLTCLARLKFSFSRMG